jgi:hypothetical protein
LPAAVAICAASALALVGKLSKRAVELRFSRRQLVPL